MIRPKPTISSSTHSKTKLTAWRDGGWIGGDWSRFSMPRTLFAVAEGVKQRACHLLPKQPLHQPVQIVVMIQQRLGRQPRNARPLGTECHQSHRHPPPKARPSVLFLSLPS